MRNSSDYSIAFHHVNPRQVQASSYVAPKVYVYAGSWQIDCLEQDHCAFRRLPCTTYLLISAAYSGQNALF